MAVPSSQLPAAHVRLSVAKLLARYREVRQRSLELVAPLSAEDACVQSMPDASPAKWHLAHVTWFFETFVLEAHETGFRAHHAAFRELYNSYYNGIGKQFSRPQRGMITRPSLAEVLDYRSAVDERMSRVIEQADADLLATVELGLHHEQQHQELLLMDIKHLLSLNPLAPAYSADPVVSASGEAMQWRGSDGGLVTIGAGEGFHFDNETPAHRVWLEPYRLASRLVSNAEYREFIDDGGYRNPLLWLADGWATVQTNNWTAPAYWRRRDDAWQEFTLHGERPLDAHAPVCHLSYYEADAYAEWRGARLPSEYEWEHAACDPAGAAPRAMPKPSLLPLAVPAGPGYANLGDAVWQWTRSAYLPYPGFRPATGAVGEYNGKFMSNQMVLKGGACITPSGHARASYRNFFYPHQRWAYSGLRLAAEA